MSTPPGPPAPGSPEYYPQPPSVPEQEMQGAPGYGQPGYGQPGYGQPVYGQPVYGQPGNGQQPPPGTNGLAIAALIFGIVFFPLGFIFGFIALSKIKKTGQAGRGMAIAGIVLSAVTTVIWAAIIVFTVIVVKTVLNTSGAPGFGLKPGDCFNHAAAGSTTEVLPVSCTTAHDGETVAVIAIPQATYPDTDTIKQQATEQCAPAAKTYLDPTMDYPDLALGYLYPEQGSWTLGNHSIVCFVGGANGKLSTPARGTGTPTQH